MHITMANNYLYLRGGSERVMFDEAEALRATGETVSFLGRYRPGDPAMAHTDLLPPLVDLETLSFKGKIAQATRIIYNGDTFRRCAAFIAREHPNLIHGHNIYGGLTTAVCDAAQRHAIPMVLTLHDYKLICPSYLMLNHGRICEACLTGGYSHCLRNRCHKNNVLYSAIYTAEAYFNRWLRKYDHIRYFISPSRFLLDKVIASGVAPARLRYVPNAVDVRNYAPEFTPGTYALYVGRLSKEKGLPTLLRAMTMVDVPLRIVGDGPLRAELEAYIATQNLTDRVHLCGYQSGDALARMFREAACLVIPSEWYENAPMSVLEAYAYGKPVIGARIGGIPEMIDDGQTGLLFDAGSADQLASCLQALWNRTRDDREAMGRAAHTLLCSRFSYAAHTDALMQIYRDALT